MNLLELKEVCEIQSIKNEIRQDNFYTIRVNGDSMQPTLYDGDRISLRQINNIDFLPYGYVYFIITDQYRMIKRVKRFADNEKEYLILHSDNPDYDDMIMRRDKIKQIYLVKTSFSYRKMF